MKTKQPIVRISCILSSLLLSVGMISCGGTETPPKTTDAPADNNPAATTPVETEAEETVRSLSAVPESLDFGGAEFRIASRNTSLSVDVDGLTGDVVNDAVYMRNRRVEDVLNVSIVDDKTENETVPPGFTRAAKAGEIVYSAVMTHITAMTDFVEHGYLMELGDVPYLDITRPYWTESVTDSLAVSNKRFLFCGDISIVDNTNIWCIFFNKRLANDLDLDSPYKALADGRWTLDYYATAMKDGARDLNGDGVYTWDQDQFALLNPTETLCGMYNSMDCLAVSHDKNGSLVVNIDSEKSISTLIALAKWAESGKGSIFLEAAQIKRDTQWDDLWGVFTSGKALFYNHVVNITEKMRDMNDEYGILPMPKYDEAQEKYISSTQEWGQCVYGVPVTTPDVEMSGAVLEYMAGLSTDTVRSAYYDIALTRKYSRDEESIQSLDILFNNVVIDPCFSYLDITVNDVFAKSDAIASSIEKKISKIEKRIAKLEETVSNLE